MSVRIRLMADTTAELDAHETALRGALDVAGEPGKDYPNRGDSGLRRYLVSNGVQGEPATSPRAAAEDAKARRDLGDEISILRDADRDLRAQPWYPLQPGDVVLLHLRPVGQVPAYGTTYLADGEIDHDDSPLLRTVSETRFPPEQDDDVPPYRLRYDTDQQGWALAARDLDDNRLGPWLLAPGKFGRDVVEDVQRWATAQINSVEGDGAVTGWTELPDDAGWVPELATEQAEPVGPPRASFYDLWFEAGGDGLVVIRAGAVVHGQPAPALPS